MRRLIRKRRIRPVVTLELNCIDCDYAYAGHRFCRFKFERCLVSKNSAAWPKALDRSWIPIARKFMDWPKESCL